MASAPTPSGPPVADYARVLLRAVAREEAAGRTAPRLTEPGQATWRRRSGSADLLRLLAEDGAVVHPLPFDAATFPLLAPMPAGALRP